MADLAKEATLDSPLAQLCKNTLDTIAAPPGKVYDGEKMDPSVASEVVVPVVKAVTKVLADKFPNAK